jgi:hypothetical protein
VAAQGLGDRPQVDPRRALAQQGARRLGTGRAGGGDIVDDGG